MLVADVLGAVGSLLGGGVTGIIGTGITKYFELQTAKVELQRDDKRYAHDEAMKKADADIMAQEWAARTRIASVEAADHETQGDAAAFTTSQGNEPKRYSDGVTPSWSQAWLLFILDFLRGIVRPALTVYLCALTTRLYLEAHAILAGKDILSPTEAADLVRLIVNTILYLTTTCILWWFGTRNKQKAPPITVVTSKAAPAGA